MLLHYERVECRGLQADIYRPQTMNRSEKACFNLFMGMQVRVPDPDRIRRALKRDEKFTLNRTSYGGRTPRDLALTSGCPVHVTYDPAVCLGTGLYNEETMHRHLNMALDLADGRPFTPVTHSLSTILGMKLLNIAFRKSHDAENALPGVITSPFTSMEDALTFPMGRERKLLEDYIPWMPLFRLGKGIPGRFPLYPFAAQYYHDTTNIDTEQNKEWGAERWIDPRSAKYLLKQDGLEIANDIGPHVLPLTFITSGDMIFSSTRQSEIGNALRGDVCWIGSGHRWFTEKVLTRVLSRIAGHHAQSLEHRTTLREEREFFRENGRLPEHPNRELFDDSPGD